MGRENAAKIDAATDQAKEAMDRVSGLKVEHYWRAIGAAKVSGTAQGIVALLELPEIKAVTSFEGVKCRPANSRGRW